MLLDDVLVELLRADVETHGRHEPAAGDRVFARVAECRQLTGPLVIGEVEPSDQLHRFERQVAGSFQPRREGTQLGLGGHAVEPADPHVDRMDRPAADQVDELVADLLQIETTLHHVAVSGGQFDGAVVPEEVGGMKQVDVQRMALDPLAAVHQPPQIGEGPVDGGPASVFDRVACAHLVGDRADPADAGGEIGRLGVRPTTKERLEEARWLVDLQLDELHLTVADHDVHRPFALHPGEGVDREHSVGIGPWCHVELPSATRRSLSTRNGSAFVLNVRSMRMRSRRPTPNRSSCADSAAGFASSAGPKQP